MGTPMREDPNADGYVLARSTREYDRLRAQAQHWAPFTDRVLASAGLRTGMTTLDAGCGPGDVMRLMGRYVGPKGSVTGVDIDADVGAYGLRKVRLEEAADFHFHAADLLKGETVPGAPFDMVFCRFLLIHMDNPVEMVRRLAALTKPGGTLVAMDYVMAATMVAPPDPVLMRGIEIINRTLTAAGRPLDAGVRLASWFREAGLRMPHGTDLQGTLIVTHPNLQLAEGVAGFGARAVRLGVATDEEIAGLPDRIRAVAARGEHCYHSPTVGAAWTRVGT